MRKTQVLALLVLFSLFLGLGAAPLNNIKQTVVQPDGTKLNCLASGDEFFNYLHDAKGYTIIQDKNTGWYEYAAKKGGQLVTSGFVAGQVNPADYGLTPGLKISKALYQQKRDAMRSNYQVRDVPTSGTINNIVVFIRFADETESEAFPHPRSWYDEYFNSSAGPSLKHYYDEVSYQTLTVNSHYYPNSAMTTNVSYQGTHPRNYYKPYSETNPDGYTYYSDQGTREQELLRDACAAVDAQIPASLDIDSDNDGYVDNVIFLISGNPEGWSDLLWPHHWGMMFAQAYINGKEVMDYNFDLAGDPNYFSVGVLCHEFFHTLGAPDLYYYEETGAPDPVENWDIMGANVRVPVYMGAWMKHKYGDWIENVPVIDQSGTYTLNPLTSSSNNIYRINSPNNSDEFFILEYRKKEGLYEVNTPGNYSGLLVYRINSSIFGNSGGPPNEVYIYRPNGTVTDDGSLSNAIFCQQAGRISFNRTSNPQPFLSDGSDGDINILNIGQAGPTLQFSVYINPLITPDESFENGLNDLPWVNGTSWGWWQTNETAVDGDYSLRSGAIYNDRESTVAITQTNAEAGEISFYCKTSCEEGYVNYLADYLAFYIDGVRQDYWDGEQDWMQVSFEVPAGTHTYRWTYYKDSHTSYYQDRVWIDSILFPGGGTYAPPTDLQANITANSVKLDWFGGLAGGMLNGYKVYRNNQQLNTNLLEAPTYTDTGLSAGTYNYTVVAVYQGVETEQSEPVEAVVSFGVPTNLRYMIPDATGYIILQWDQPDGAAGMISSYNVYNNQQLVGSVNNLYYVNTTPVAGATYVYQVSAVYNGGFESDMCPAITVTVPGGGPSTPSNVAFVIDNNTATISFSQVSGASQYHVYACGIPAGTYVDVTSEGSFTTLGQTVYWSATQAYPKRFYYVTAE